MSDNLHQIMQNKANFGKAQMNVSSILTKDYENESVFGGRKNKPNQTQFSQGQDDRELLYRKRLTKMLPRTAKLTIVRMLRLATCSAGLLGVAQKLNLFLDLRPWKGYACGIRWNFEYA